MFPQIGHTFMVGEFYTQIKKPGTPFGSPRYLKGWCVLDTKTGFRSGQPWLRDPLLPPEEGF